MSTTQRTRNRGGFTPRIVQQWINNSSTGQTNLNAEATVTTGTAEHMTDWVTKPFVKGRTIVNTEMNSVKTTLDHTPASGQDTMTKPPGFVGWDNAFGQIVYDRDGVLSSLESQLSKNIDVDALISLAATSALAGVRKPEVSGLVTLAEIRSTVDSLIHPINSTLKWLGRNAPSKIKKQKSNRRKKLALDSKDLADQHLTVVFGIMPFISDIQGILKALEAIEPIPARMTSRGSASDHDFVSSSGEEVVYDDGNNVTKLIHSEEAHMTVTVRAYQLYEASVSLSDALGLSVEDIPKAFWQTATLSFVVDWFANVSQFIGALTPRVGINYITSGVTVTTVTASTSNYSRKGTHRQDYGWSSAYIGGSQSRVVVAKRRGPTSLFAHTGLHLKSNMHREVLDTFKITAGLSLITQRLSKLL